MDALRSITEREPALLLGVVKSFIALLVAFGIGLSGEQVGAIMAFVTVLGAVATRMLVWSPAGHEKAVAKAKEDAIAVQQGE